MAVDSSDVFARLERERQRHLEELKEFLRIPSSSADPEHATDIERCAGFVEEQLRRAGLDAEIVENGGRPIVYGQWLGAPGKPTVLIYGHYDVQPVDPLEEWRNPPFEPTLEGESILWRAAPPTTRGSRILLIVKAVEPRFSPSAGRASGQRQVHRSRARRSRCGEARSRRFVHATMPPCSFWRATRCVISDSIDDRARSTASAGSTGLRGIVTYMEFDRHAGRTATCTPATFGRGGRESAQCTRAVITGVAEGSSRVASG